jgi:hypothetical protein
VFEILDFLSFVPSFNLPNFACTTNPYYYIVLRHVLLTFLKLASYSFFKSLLGVRNTEQLSTRPSRNVAKDKGSHLDAHFVKKL